MTDWQARTSTPSIRISPPKRPLGASIATPSLNVGIITGGSNTNVGPDKVTLRLDRSSSGSPRSCGPRSRAGLALGWKLGGGCSPRAQRPSPARARLAATVQGTRARCLPSLLAVALVCFVPMRATMARPACRSWLYGAGPRTLLQANAKRADENILLADLRRATIVIARGLLDLLAANTVRAMQA
jgi:succinyl-diaminopimelate desuccinylase